MPLFTHGHTEGTFNRELENLEKYENMIRIKVGKEEGTLFFDDKKVLITNGGLSGKTCYQYSLKSQQKVLLEILIRQETEMSRIEMEQYKNQGFLPC